MRTSEGYGMDLCRLNVRVMFKSVGLQFVKHVGRSQPLKVHIKEGYNVIGNRLNVP